MLTIKELLSYTNSLLKSDRFRDFAPNGLQVEGKESVQHIVSGVTASQALVEAAVEAQADAVLVHHGYFWKGEDQCIVGMKRKRIQLLLEHDINLLAYHLPLDAHETLGNNAELARLLGIQVEDVLARDGVGNVGVLDRAVSVTDFSTRITQTLQREPLVISGGEHPIRRVAWCTGGAQNRINDAIRLGADAYISGEISEHTVHTAREMGIHYFAAGHHATERYGVQALGEHLAEHFGLSHRFIDMPNPV